MSALTKIYEHTHELSIIRSHRHLNHVACCLRRQRFQSVCMRITTVVACAEKLVINEANTVIGTPIRRTEFLELKAYRRLEQMYAELSLRNGAVERRESLIALPHRPHGRSSYNLRHL